MARKRRQRFTVFSLSLLDVMACGFGAVILIFFIINHDSRARAETINSELLGEVGRLEAELVDAARKRVELVNSLERMEKEQVITQGRSRELIRVLEEKKVELAAYEQDTTALEEDINKLKADLKAAEEDARRLEGSVAGPEEQGDAIRTFRGQGDRQYLTGLKLGGEHILLLVDVSASMLDDSLVNVIRRRNLSDAEKRASAKWRRAVSTVDWLTARFPVGSQFQIYAFNTEATPVLEGTGGRWLKASDGSQLTAAVNRLRGTVPQAGTSLENALAVIGRLNPRPDNVYLITDGLPTQGTSAPILRGTVSGSRRLSLFEQAMDRVPRGVPVNIILFPMEGDPLAASAYWRLAQNTRGAFLSPSKAWP